MVKPQTKFYQIHLNDIASKFYKITFLTIYTSTGGADKSLARPGRKQATATEGFDIYISYL